MKILTILLFSLMISFNSYGEWTKVSSNANGMNFYIDFDNIKKNNGYVYYWQLLDYLKPSEWGDLSGISLYEVNCNIPFKERRIASRYYILNMGNGDMSSSDDTTREWYYATPGSSTEIILNIVCKI